MTGQTLSHYQIDAELGRGGMGVVYRATDTKLNRTVALKVLPAAALASPDDRARFVREAQSAAQLNHPNIATVHGIDEAVPEGEGAGGESRLFIAMEYIEGETLRERAQKGPMKLQQAVSIAGQIAEALKVAHAKDIVHRDIKSANIMLTGDGVAKVLDFGLAKTNASTMLTRMGSTLGTVAYMSPEQARGEEVDGRSDLYSLGTVLYEMIAGRLPFAGDYEQAVLYGILNEEPEPLTALRTGVPMQLEWIVNKLLAKEARHRYQTAADLAADLETVDLSGSGFSRRSMPAAAPVPGPKRRTMVVAAAALVAGVAIGAASVLLRPDPEPERKTVKRFEVPLPEDIGPVSVFIASDGSRVAVTASSGATVIDLASGDQHTIEQRGILGVRFSPDAEQLLISSMEGADRSRADGSDRISVVQYDGFTVAGWGPGGEIVYSTLGSFLVTIPPVGLADTLHVEEGVMAVPGRLLADGRVALEMASLGDQTQTTWALDLATGERQRVGDYVHQVLPTGHLIVSDQQGEHYTLIPIDLDSFEPVGPRVPLQFLDDPFWDVAHDGTLVYLPSPEESGRTELRVLHANGSDRLIAPDVGGDFDVTDSGDRVVATLPDSEDSDASEYHLTVIDVRSGLQTRIGGGGMVRNVRWHPSGLEVTGQSERRDAIVSTPADRSEAPRELFKSLGEMGAVSWTADGSRMVHSTFSTEGELASGISLYDVEADSSWWIVEPAGLIFGPQVTADGRFVAYSAVAAEDPHIAILEIETGRNWSLPREGAYRWSATGDGLEYRKGDSLMVSSVEFEPTFRVTGQPEVVSVLPEMRDAKRLANGDIFYTRRVGAEGEDQEEAPVLKVVINWFEEVKRLAPHPR